MSTDLDELRCWDDGGKSIDRYTVVWPDGDYLAMDANPYRPSGFGQHGGGTEYEPDCEKRGGELWSYLGRMISFHDLPTECQKLVLSDLKAEAEAEAEIEGAGRPGKG